MNTEHTNQSTAPKPFGYFKAEARGWVCLAKEEDGAIALYDRPQAEPVNQQLLALVKSFGHKTGCAKNAFGEQCTCGADEAIAAAEQVTLCASCARADVNCPIYPQQTASCVEHRPAAKQQAEPAARDVIGKLIELTRAVNIALDDSEERDGIDGREHVIGSVNFDAVCDALEALEELPDNKPGWAMNAADKAAWALRHLTDAAQPPAVGVPQATAEDSSVVQDTVAVPEGWSQQVFELCNDMMGCFPMTEAMMACMYESTGDRGKYPNAADWLARAALAAAQKGGTAC